MHLIGVICYIHFYGLWQGTGQVMSHSKWLLHCLSAGQQLCAPVDLKWPTPQACCNRNGERERVPLACCVRQTIVTYDSVCTALRCRSYKSIRVCNWPPA